MYIKDILDRLVEKYNQPEFILNDPIYIPHQFHRKEDIEIAGFFAATFSWGNRKSIIASSLRLMYLMDNDPYDFVLHATQKELKPLSTFVYRTFNGTDCVNFVHSLQHLYSKMGGLETVFYEGFRLNNDIKSAISYFREQFLSFDARSRTQKHVANPLAGSSGKRLNMFLRWMVRYDAAGIDFGLWKQIPMSALKIPLDIHSGTIARQLGLLERKQNDWKAVEELTKKLQEFDSFDPIKYDFALFGAGVNRYF